MRSAIGRADAARHRDARHDHVRGRRERPAFDDEDLLFAQDLALRAATAVQNARLYREARDAVRKRDDFLSAPRTS